MAESIQGRYLRELPITADPTGAEMYGEKGGKPVRVRFDELGGIATLDALASDEPGKGASMVAFRQDASEAVNRTALQKLRDFPISPADFGAVGDGVTDDTIPIRRAAEYAASIGRCLDFGDASKVYRVTDTIALSGDVEAVVWQASGATIFLDSPASIRHFVDITARASRYSIKGPLSLDSNRKSFVGFSLRNLQDGSDESHWKDALVADLSVSNVYRADTSFPGGDGIFVYGAWNAVELRSPVVKNVVMGPNALVQQSQGVSGITITRLMATRASTRFLTVSNPRVENVSSENPDDSMDMDGLKVFADHSSAETTPYFADISGAYFKNCWGRAIKMQTDFCTVRGVKVVRDRGSNVVPPNPPEFDFQVGSGLIADVECRYDGIIPPSVVHNTNPGTAGAKPRPVTVRGLKIVCTPGTPTIRTLVTVNGSDSSGLPAMCIVSDVDLVGSCDRVVSLRTVGSDNKAILSNIVAEVLEGVVSLWGYYGSAPVVTQTAILMNSVVNTGAQIPAAIRQYIEHRPHVSATHCLGIRSYSRNAGSDLGVGGITRVDAIAATVASGAAATGQVGLIRPLSAYIDNGNTRVFPWTSISSNEASMILVSAAGSIHSQAIFAVGNRSVPRTFGATEATNWALGDQADPGEGMWRIWCSTEGIHIRNMSGSGYNVTILAIG